MQRQERDLMGYNECFSGKPLRNISLQSVPPSPITRHTRRRSDGPSEQFPTASVVILTVVHYDCLANT
ncbi:hypothetical protein MFRU_007g00240 [Monilinia fructicola]|nr:hypothetical protein MFRU_007g00240 [Monilinia fructicola]